MKLEYNQRKATFAELTKQISDQLGADAVMLVIFGSAQGSGCCCDIRPMHPERQQWLAAEIVRNLRAVADALEVDLREKTFPIDDDPDQYEQALD